MDSTWQHSTKIIVNHSPQSYSSRSRHQGNARRICKHAKIEKKQARCTSLVHDIGRGRRKKKTYNTKDSLVVTDPTTRSRSPLIPAPQPRIITTTTTILHATPRIQNQAKLYQTLTQLLSISGVYFQLQKMYVRGFSKRKLPLTGSYRDLYLVTAFCYSIAQLQIERSGQGTVRSTARLGN